MLQHRNALKRAGPRIDNGSNKVLTGTFQKGKKSKSKSNRTRSNRSNKIKKKPVLSRYKSSHAIVDKKRKIEIERQNHIMEQNLMNTSFSIDNKEPVRLTKSLHHITRKNHQRRIESKNRKIQHYLNRTQSTIPNANELQRRWEHQKVLKQLSFDIIPSPFCEQHRFGNLSIVFLAILQFCNIDPDGFVNRVKLN